MSSFVTRCLALAGLVTLAAPAFAAPPPSADVAGRQLVEAVTCKRHLTPAQFAALAKVLKPTELQAYGALSDGEYALTTPLLVLGQPVNRLHLYDGANGEDGVDSYTAYFSTASTEQMAALAKIRDNVAGDYTLEMGRHDLNVRQQDGQASISCSYDLR
ncbi:hypothetical protein [Stenotrophomonas rhizophila]|uniref:hypothetical protein n=1 Tax=Stenotrophomonas rhizophila TaxID=216778 RepID=UPI0010C0F11C|nr:hypothetical protein [Stenotrophomonas rhizophila]TKK02444.1 hypothetical protein SrhCFBP13529_19915 [Stenotrophomonas rhizophila]